MVFRMPRFIRRYIRSRMHPMAESKATDVKLRLSLVYAFIAWNAGGFVLYKMLHGEKYWLEKHGLENELKNLRPAERYAKILGIPNAEYKRIKGLQTVEEGVINTEVKEAEKATFFEDVQNEITEKKRKAADVQLQYKKEFKSGSAS